MMKVNVQTVMSAPTRTLLGSYTTKSGQVKNRYRTNPDAKPVKRLVHTFETDDRKRMINILESLK